MEMAVIHFIILGVVSRLTTGAGVLPDGPLNVAVGETVTFTPTLTPPGITLLTVNWKFGDQNIITFSGVTVIAPEYEGRVTFSHLTASLELRNVALNDAGEYSVSIIREGEQAKDGTTTLGVYEPVSNVTLAASSTDLVEFNSSVTLNCSSSGSSLSFLWLNSSSEVTESDGVQLTDGDSSLTIVNVTRYDQGPFRCLVSNPISNGSSNEVQLSISYGPENVRLTSPPNEHHAVGSSITLSCSADSRPAAMFNWFLNGVQLTDTGAELRLTNIQMSQSGDYSCQAFNSETLRYETSLPSRVTVLERISAVSVTSTINLPIEGNSVNLTCEAAGSVFNRRWKKDDSDLILADNMMLYDENRGLSFHPLRRADRGKYSCNVSNPVSAEEATFNMDVNYGPDNVQIRGPSEVHVEQAINLTCSAESNPSASYTWKLNGTVIHSSSVYTKDTAEFSDSGEYTCQVTNKITEITSLALHALSVTVPVTPSGCSGGCIAGIVIGCLVVLGAAAGGGYCLYSKKRQGMTV